MRKLFIIALALGGAALFTSALLPESFNGQDQPPTSFQGVAATNFIQWSADEQVVLTGSPGGDLLLFDPDTGALEKRIAGGDSYSAFAVFLPGDRRIAVSDYAGRLSVYDRASGRSLARMRGHDAEIACVACSPDGSALATSDKDGNVVIWSWDGTDLSIARRLVNAVDDFANQLTLSPDGSRLGVCGSASRTDGTGEVTVFDVNSGERVMRALTPAFANAIEFSTTGEVLYVGTAKGKIRGLDVATGGPTSVPDGTGPQGIADAQVVANDIALRYDGDRVVGAIAACGDGYLRSVTFTGRTLWSVRADPSTCYFASVSPTSGRIATSGTDGALRIFSSEGAALQSIGR